MAGNGRPAVSILFPEQHREAARSLGRAFINDPPFKVVLPDVTEPIERARRLTIFFEAILGIQRQSGEPVLGALIDGKVAGAAVVEGADGVSIAKLVLNGVFQLPGVVRGLGWGGMYRGIQLMNELAKNHPKEPHLYLNFLGVDPDYQRHHHCGSALLDHLRELAAQRPSLCGVYLETATEANVAYYQSRGYEVLGEIFPLGCRMWRMLQRRR
jgi:ribosomal protein S18 acetylase RimI-like enzyme